MTNLLHDIQRRLFPVTGRRAREQGANGADRLPVAPDNSPDIGLPHLQPEDGHAAIRNFREHHFLGEFDQLPNDKLEKLSHIRA
jgi:hypothetical protein